MGFTFMAHPVHDQITANARQRLTNVLIIVDRRTTIMNLTTFHAQTVDYRR